MNNQKIKIITVIFALVFLIVPIKKLLAYSSFDDFISSSNSQSSEQREAQSALNENDRKILEIENLLKDPTKIGTVDVAATKAQLATLEAEQDRLYAILTQANKQSFWTRFWEKLKDTTYKGAVNAFWAAARNAVFTMAKESAIWIGSGGRGQEPLLVSEQFGTYLNNIADNAAGSFLQQLGQTNGFLKFNLCEPDFAVKLSIGLGLADTFTKTTPDCTFSKMKANWEQELEDPNFLSNFQDMFKPESNDLGIALSLQTKMWEDMQIIKDEKGKQLIADGGWLDVRDIAGNLTGLKAKDTYQNKMDRTNAAQAGLLTNFTGTLADAVNIFLNNLAISGYDRLLESLGVKNTSSPYSGNYGGFLNYNASPANGGATAVESKARKMVEADFSARGDYNILSELTSCSDLQKAGPTNCVIDEKFRQAISTRLTVGEAIEQGYLNGDGSFGYLANGLEPNYQEGYPYRSMPILRKFRIIPVGWELAAQTLRESGRALTLKQVVGCFDNTDSANTTCAGISGLVDPTWVLKAPLNYCKKEGPGPEIINSQLSGSSLSLLRNENYCADEQSCVKENDNGSCLYYGYCTEEKRTWQFSADSCEPVYNTCESFSQGSGQLVSYLKNTLSYCDAGGAGCAEYSRAYNYDTQVWNPAGDKIWLNSQVSTCNSVDEGCRQLIRTKAGLGVNLIKDDSFENKDSAYWGSTINFYVGDSIEGVYSAQAASEGTSLVKYVDVGKDTKDGQYVWSFYAKNCSGATYSLSVDRVNDTCIDGVCGQTINYDGDWQRYSIAYNFKLDNPEHQLRLAFQFPADNGACLIDAMQLEEGAGVTTYNSYGSQGVVYEKLLPNYLTGLCENSTVCDKYAQFCQVSEVGCELYTSQTDGSSIPAKTTAKNKCSSSCVGYDNYIQQASAFDSLAPAYLIPSTASTCTAEAAGCDEFTNLDKVSSGGEAREYYSYLKQCIKPDATQCADFYTWEGSSESGYQIKNFSLKAEPTGAPALSNAGTYENRTCASKTDYDPINNPLCREFFDKAGQAHYAFSIYTISCSENCHPFRRTELNYDDSLSETECSGSDKHWDNANNSCVVCKNGGTWDNGQGACIYMAIPNEGNTCSASQVGCRAYTGNKGANYQIINQWNFDGGLDNWEGNNSNIEKSQVSLNTGGSSLFVKDGSYQAYYPIGTAVNTSSSYVLNFLAKSDNSSAINFSFVDADGNVAFFNALPNSGQPRNITLSSEWKLYTVNIDFSNYRLEHSVDVNEVLEVVGSSAFYIDNVRLTEVIDRYYLIKNSWSTPDVCNQDLDGNVYPLYALGCDHYQDRGKNDLYFYSFGSLCSESAVGCELLIDTHNSSNYNSVATNGITVPEDNYIYAVYDAGKECNSADKGCELMGKKYAYGSEYLYSNVYILNNPDKYGDILCSSDEVGCTAWKSESGITYFKNPENLTCNWHDNKWWKTKVKRCGKTGNICLTSADCVNGVACEIEATETACPTTSTKTIGYGGDGNEVYQPTIDSNGQSWAGLCPTAQSGCTEYIDPVSQFSANLVDNPSCLTVGGVACAGWNNNSQDLNLKANTLYVLGTSTSATISASSLKVLGEDNNFSSSNTVDSAEGNNLFLIPVTKAYTIKRGSTNGEVSVRQAIVEYRINSKIDKTTCTTADFGKGCVYFNERASKGQDNWSSLSADSDGNGLKDANSIIKVAPNRVCDKWLACKSYVKDEKDNNICYDIGLCQSADDKGNCSSWAVNDTTSKSLVYNGTNASALANLSGYSKVGTATSAGLGLYQVPDSLYSFGNMAQKGEVANLINGNFEFSGTNGYPLGWIYELGGGLTQTSTTNASGATTTTTTWNSNIFTVVTSPYTMQSANLCFKLDNLNNCQIYAPEGTGLLRLGAGFSASSELFEVGKATDYVVSGYLNTKNLSAGKAKLQVLNESGSVLIESSLDAGSQSWVFKVAKFKTDSTLVKIKLLTDEGKGAVYFDDIKVKPALEAKENWNIAQSCRLYPEDSSLSCDYYDDSGIRKKGWLGYCLEYDRAPGDPNACILWYPIDRVKGDGLTEEGAGYAGKYPVYYTLQGTTQRKYVYRHVFGYGALFSGNVCKSGSCPDGYITKTLGCTRLGGDDGGTCVCIPNGSGLAYSDGSADNFNTIANADYDCAASTGLSALPNDLQSSGDGWYYYDQSTGARVISSDLLSHYSTLTSFKYGTISGKWAPYLCDGGAASCSFTKELYRNELYASKVIQTVTPTGQNKFWSSRVFSGSSYVLPLTGYTYNTVNAPFGSITAPFPANNPYEWDGNSTTDAIEPLANYPTIGQPYSCTGECSSVAFDPSSDAYPYKTVSLQGSNTGIASLQNLFVKSYGTWYWDATTGHYIMSSNQDDKIETPVNSCLFVNGSYIRGDADYCAIPPAVSNIKVNGLVSSNLSLVKNSFIHLTFNSNVDDEQQPLTMYAVDWSDGEKTIVSGIEMYDRPNVDNPHSLYHLYDYWDLKSKNSRGIGNISCGTSNGIGYCSIKPKVQIKDNWGWCSGGVKDTCTIWSSFGGAVVVREK